MKNIILASKSPTRRKILEDMGIFPEILPTDASEDYGNLTDPAAIVMRLSELKAHAADAALKRSHDTLIIAADTLVFFGGRAIGKPTDLNDAKLTLAALSDSVHYVYTGFTLIYGVQKLTDFECTKVVFKKISAYEIERYTSDRACLSKAGSYGAEGAGAIFIKRTEGDYLNIGGLPVCKISELLSSAFGVSIFDFASFA